MVKILTVIPARGGSKSIPRKNIKIFQGFPLIKYSIDYSLKSKLIEKTSDHKLRVTGVFFSILGFLIVWYIKN